MLFIFLEGKYNTMEIKRLVYFLDRNNDGLISFEDFHDLLMPIKSDFETIENNNELFNNNAYKGQLNKPSENYNYLNKGENNNYNYKWEKYNAYERKTYYINYNIKTRNRYDISKNRQKQICNNDQNSKDLILNKYINDSKPIYEQNESYEKDIDNNENYSQHLKNMNKEDERMEDNNNEQNMSSLEQKILNENNNLELNNEDSVNNDNSKNENQNSEEKNNQNLLNQEKTNINENNFDKNGEKQIEEIEKNEINNNLNNKLIAENVINEQIISIKKENAYREQYKENINNNVYLQKFPNTFGKNEENENSLKQVIKEGLKENSLNVQENNNINNKKNPDKYIKQNIINRKINKKKKNTSLSLQNSYQNNFFDFQGGPNQTFNEKLKYNLESNPNDDILPSNKYYFPLIEDRSINLDIKYDMENDTKKLTNMVDKMSLFFEYIHLIIYYENKLEHLKESLSLREDLSIKEIFYLFDKDKNKHITIDNFKIICKTVFKIFPTSDQIKLVIKRYKKDLNLNSKNKEDFSLTLVEFSQIFIPKRSDYKSIKSYKDKKDKTKSKLSKKSKNILIELIKCLIIKESNYYKIRCQLDQNSLEFIWNQMRKNSQLGANIGKIELNQFLEEYGYILGEKQIEIIFNIFDKDNKGLINDNDFFEEMFCE